jgi:hypothetical protein
MSRATFTASPVSMFATPVMEPSNWFTTQVVTPPAASGRSEPKKNSHVPAAAQEPPGHCDAMVQAVPSFAPP